LALNDDILELALSGEGITPDNIRASEVGEIIAAYESSLLNIIAKDNPEVNLEEVFISLIQIQANSTHLKFKPKFKDLVFGAALVLNTSLSNHQLDNLPYKTVEELQKIWSFTKKRNCVADFVGVGNIPKAQITADSEIKISEAFFYQGETKIYAVVERVGGATPRVRLKLDDGSVIYVETNTNTAKTLAQKLYDGVCLKGMAKWRKDDFQIEDFKIEEVVAFEEGGIKESVKQLKEVIGKYWDDIPDIDNTIIETRYFNS